MICILGSTGKSYAFDPGSSERVAMSTFSEHKSAILCPVGAFADYMVWRLHHTDEPWPEFDRKESFYKTPLILGKD